MDNGPFRMGNSAPAARGTGSRSVAPRRETERAAPVEEEPVHKAPVHRSVNAHHVSDGGSNKKKFIIIGVIVAVVIVVLSVCGWIMTHRPSAGVTVDSSKYQAVFFTNGQVYFGKLQILEGDYMKLTGVFYLQTKEAEADGTKNLQKAAADSSGDVQLIKLGNEIHGPSDEMVINRDQVLFFENLKSDGKVASSIDQYNKSQK